MSGLELLLVAVVAALVRAILRLFRSYSDPEVPLDREGLLDALTETLEGYSAKAQVLAVALVNSTVEKQLGVEHVLSADDIAAALTPTVDTHKLRAAFAVIIDDEGSDRLMRLTRLAKNEVYYAAQQATHRVIESDPAIVGWVRQMETDACQLCRWWSRKGRVWPVTHRMPTHKGCACTPRPVTKKEVTK